MGDEFIQTVLLDDGRYARISFEPAGRGRIRILSILVSEDEDAEDELCEEMSADDFEIEELRELIAQLDLSDLDFNI